jgi:hypothetical protein
MPVSNIFPRPPDPEPVIAYEYMTDSNPTSMTFSSSYPELINGDRYTQYRGIGWLNKWSYGIDLGTAGEINGLDMWTVYIDAGVKTTFLNAAYGTFDAYKSDDNSTWTLIERFAVPPRINTVQDSFAFRCEFSTPQTARYFKLHGIPNDVDNNNNVIVTGDGGTSQIRMAEIELYIID